jgi:uncharacterized protein (TIGR04551 family)
LAPPLVPLLRFCKPRWLASAALVCTLAATAAAADPQVVLPALPPQAAAPLLHLDWHGEVRGRGESLSGVRINREDAARPAYLDVRHGNADAASQPTDGQITAADLRARLSPVLRVGDWGAVHSQFEAWGVAGGEAQLSSVGERFLQTDWQSESLRAGWGVRRLWLQARLFGAVQFEAGRTPDHFGMGMLRNRGDGLLEDVQSTVDRVRLQADLFGLRLAISRANLASWPTATEGGALASYNLAYRAGRPLAAPIGSGAATLPLQDSADVIRYDLEVQGGSHQDGRGLVWSGALLWQSQDQALRLESIRDPTTPSPQQQVADPGCGDDCILLVQRTLRLYTVQGALDWRTQWLGSPLRVQAEVAGRYGTIGRTDVTTTVDAKTVIAGALAARATWQRDRFDLQFDGGAASGEGGGGFGVNDSTTFRSGSSSDSQPRSLLTGMRAHRSFRVDGLLFRDVIGAVTNAAWFRPALRWHLFGAVRPTDDPSADTTAGLALEAGVLGASAVARGGTPGGQSWLGWEPEVALHYRSDRRLDAWLRGSILVPGGALANRAGVEADPAYRSELIVRWQF